MTEKEHSEQEQPEFSYYAARKHIYTAKVKGKYRSLKWYLLTLFLGIYYLLPFLKYNRGENAPDQAVLIDLTSRKFYFFAIEIWPQEVYIFTGILLLMALLLFFITTIAGRVWCGYACFQTLWTDLFMLVERLTEGDRHRRIRLDKAPISLSKIAKKTIKHILWIIISLATGGALVLYFNDAYSVIPQIISGTASFAMIFWLLFLASITYIFAGFAREQICTYACPYARFQGVMYDADTLIVTYDEKRGEPRGKNVKTNQETSAEVKQNSQGDCIDCGRCSAVCPTGIDIRNGQQFQCITCALCIDACNEIMTKIGKPEGLIRYDTLSRINQPESTVNQSINSLLLRPRVLIYGSMLLVVSSAIIYTLLTKPLLNINLIKDRNPLFITLADGSLRNSYTLRIVNKSHKNSNFTINIEGLEAKLSLLNSPQKKIAEPVVSVKANSVGTFRLFMDIKSGYKKGVNTFTFHVKNAEMSDSYQSKFITPKE